MKAETAETKSVPTTPGKTPDVASLTEHLAVASVEAEVGEETLLREASASLPAATEEGGNKPESSGGASNLVGRINNLVTTDLQTIDSGRDFIFVCESPYALGISRHGLGD